MIRLPGLLPLLLLAGCGALRAPDGDPSPPPPPSRAEAAQAGASEVERVLAYYARLRRMAASELAREQEAARRPLPHRGGDGDRLHAALPLMLPGATAGDEARALELLEPVTRSAENSLRGLALLLAGMLNEQRRAEASAQSLQQKADALQLRADALQLKLDALMRLERNMTGRDGGARRR